MIIMVGRGRPKKVNHAENPVNQGKVCDCGEVMNIEGSILRCPKCQAWREFSKIVETKEQHKARLLKELEALEKE